jgi:hypothetical protein
VGFSFDGEKIKHFILNKNLILTQLKALQKLLKI